MTVEELITKAQTQGYSVGVAIAGYNDFPTVYRIEGFGVSLQLTENDEDSWTQFTNDDAHDFRVKSFRAEDPTDDFTWTESERLVANMQAAVSLGQITQEQANEIEAAAGIVVPPPEG